MTIYVDLVFLINFVMDFYILSGVNFLLKLNTKLIRIIFGSLVGSISLILLFLKIDILFVNIFKIIISILMVIVSFGRKNILNNIFYLYVISILLGGSIYLINNSLGYSVDSFIFINNGYRTNIIIELIISPFIVYLYVKRHYKLKKLINIMHKVNIKFKNKTLNLNGYLDTGNNLIDPYFKRPIVLVNKKYIKGNRKYIYVPFKSLNNKGLLKCVTCEYILIDNKKYNKVLIGLSENLKEDCILNERLFDL